MLIEEGYAHSLKAMLEKSRAEEIELEARRASGNLPEAAHVVRVIDWVAQLWMRARPQRTV